MMKIIALFLLYISAISGSHFRGGSISWKYIGPGNKVEFSYKLSWALNSANAATWKSTFPNGTSFTLHSGSYNQTATNPGENWEQGEGTFSYVFPTRGPYIVSFKGSSWISLGYGSGGSWNIQTKVDLHIRNDTHKPNFSPISTSRAIYRVQYGCSPRIQIPMIDSDGDTVKCRWSTSAEAQSISQVLPNALLDQDKCRIDITATSTKNFSNNAWFAVAMTIEDYPKSPITINGHVFSTNTPITQTPLQFLIRTEPMPRSNCNEKPVFVDPTPAEGTVTIIKSTSSFTTSFYIQSKVPLNVVDIIGPNGIKKSNILSDDRRRFNTWKVDINWMPTSKDKGTKIICASAEDKFQKLSETRCLTVVAWDFDPCDSHPCQNRAQCRRVGYTSNYVCHCVPGFMGSQCETEINECSSNPCQNSGRCLDLIDGYKCHCTAGFSGRQCSRDVNDCQRYPCYNGGRCYDHVNSYSCTCATGYTGKNCETNINDCYGYTCHNQGTCIDGISSRTCACRPGFTGTQCQIDINECQSNPCLNRATCINMVNGYNCSCSAGSSGINCEKRIDHCHSNPCLHGGTCVNSFDGFKCQCPFLRYGDICEYIEETRSWKCKDLKYTECTCVTTRMPTIYPKSYRIRSCFVGIGTGMTGTIILSFFWNLAFKVPKKTSSTRKNVKRWDNKPMTNVVSVTNMDNQKVNSGMRSLGESGLGQRGLQSAGHSSETIQKPRDFLEKSSDFFKY